MARSSAAESCGSASVRGCTISMTASVPQTRSFTNPTACCRNSMGSVLPISTWPRAGQNDSRSEERLTAIGRVEAGYQRPGQHAADGRADLAEAGPARRDPSPSARRSRGSTPAEVARRPALLEVAQECVPLRPSTRGHEQPRCVAVHGRVVDHRPRQGLGLKRQLPVQIWPGDDEHGGHPTELRRHRFHVQRMVLALPLGGAGIGAGPRGSPRGSPGGRSDGSRRCPHGGRDRLPRRHRR